MSSDLDFWKAWKKQTLLEKDAIEKVKLARRMIRKAVPRNELVAIYVKGSFVRREMKEGSDIDIVPIVTENRYEKDIFATNVSEVLPAIIVPLSLWEFQHNRLFTFLDSDIRALPDRFLKYLTHYQLIYGTPLDPSQYPLRDDQQAFKDEVRLIREVAIPAYEQGKVNFSTLFKEIFWLVESELNAQGIEVEHSFSGIAAAVQDKTHLIHDAYRFRTQGYSKTDEKKFVRKLEEYLSRADH